MASGSCKDCRTLVAIVSGHLGTASATRVMLLGAGELGKEVLIALQRLGVETIAVDRYADAPGHQVAHRAFVVDMTDPKALREIIERVAFGVGLTLAQGSKGKADLRTERLIGNNVIMSLGSARVSSVVVTDGDLGDGLEKDDVRNSGRGESPLPEPLLSLLRELSDSIRAPEPEDAEGRKYRLDRPFVDDDIYATETFGPITGVAKFTHFDEAMELANNHGYGLSSSIYTRSGEHASRFRERITAGMVSVNNSTSGAEAHLPFGGNGKSGNGSRQSGVWVLDQFTRWQSMNWDYAGKLQKAQMDVADLEADLSFRLG